MKYMSIEIYERGQIQFFIIDMQSISTRRNSLELKLIQVRHRWVNMTSFPFQSHWEQLAHRSGTFMCFAMQNHSTFLNGIFKGKIWLLK